MNEHCRAPNSCRGSEVARDFLLLQSLTQASVSHKNPGYEKGFDLRVLAREPGPDAKTEQGQGDHGKWQRRQPDWYGVHIERG